MDSSLEARVARLEQLILLGTYPTAAEILTKLLTVDGAASGLDADLLDGNSSAHFLAASSYTAADVLAKLLTVDGAGSGLDADLLDGTSSAGFVAAASYTAADVLAKLLTVDGAGSGIDADLLDGQSSAFYQSASNLNAGSIPGARLGAWETWVPSFSSGITVVNGTLVGDALNLAGILVFWRMHYIRGSSDSLSGAVNMALPWTAKTPASARQETVGMAEVRYVDNNVSTTAFWDGGLKYGTTTAEFVERANNASGNDDTNPLSSTAPYTWATSDAIFATGWYQPA